MRGGRERLKDVLFLLVVIIVALGVTYAVLIVISNIATPDPVDSLNYERNN